MEPLPNTRYDVITAIHDGEIERVRQLISTRDLSVMQEWSNATDGYDFLCVAVEHRQTEIVKLLLVNGSKVSHEKNGYPLTPLHYAVTNGHVEIVQLLLSHDADINAVYKARRSPPNIQGVGIAMQSCFEADVEAANNNVTPLHIAVKNKDSLITMLLLSAGADINGAHTAYDQSNSHAPLHIAVQMGNMELVEFLLSSGANFNLRGNYSATPLHIAAEIGNFGIAERLIEYGANVNAGYNTVHLNGHTPLHNAVESNSAEIVKLLLRKGADANAAGAYLITPLHLAMESGNERIVEHLLKHQANMYSLSYDNYRPLHLAALNSYVNVMKLFMQYGDYLDPKDNRTKSLLEFAVEEGYPRVVNFILKHIPDLVNEQNREVIDTAVYGSAATKEIVQSLINYGFPVDRGNTNAYLYLAVVNGYVELLEKVLESGVAAHSLCSLTTMKDLVPLQLATKNGHQDIVQILIDKGANVDVPDEVGKLAIFYSVQNGDIDLTQLLMRRGARIATLELLNLAIKGNHKRIVELILQRGVKVNVPDEHGKVPLQYVISEGAGDLIKFHHREYADEKGEIITMLLSVGADANTLTLNNVPILHAAVDNNYVRAAEALLAYRANVNSTVGVGTTALHVSASRGSIELVHLLLKFGADINFPDIHDAITPLHSSICEGQEQLVEYMLQCSANVNAATTSESKTPLHLAAQWGHLKIVRILLEYGAVADCRYHNSHKLTPLHLAAKNGYTEVAAVLLEFGADIDGIDNYGSTALHFACRKGYARTIQLLLDNGCAVNVANKSHNTPQHFVVHCNRLLPFKNDDDNYYFDIHFDMSAHILEYHVVKLAAAGLYDDTSFVYDSTYEDKLLEFREECKDEIFVMKSEPFIGTDVTFLDILTKDPMQLAKYARNRNICLIFEARHYVRFFPIYANMITCSFKRGERKRDSIDLGRKILRILFKTATLLRSDLVDRIFSYFDNGDMRTLKVALRLVHVPQQYVMIPELMPLVVEI